MYDWQYASHHLLSNLLRARGANRSQHVFDSPFAKRTQSDPFCIALTASLTDLSAVAINGKS